MRIPFSHTMSFTTQQPLDLVDIYAPLDEAGGKGMSHIMKPEVENPGLVAGFRKFPRQKAHLQMVASRCAKHPEFPPGASGVKRKDNDLLKPRRGGCHKMYFFASRQPAGHFITDPL